MAKDAGKLRDQAANASAKGKHKKARDIYLQLEALEPNDGGWSRRVGESCRQLDDEAGAIEAFGRACQRYASQGFLVKAVATCKIILRIDPTHAEAQAQLLAFNAERGLFIKDTGEAAKRVAPASSGQASEPEGPIESMALHKEVSGAAERTIGALPSGVFEIPLELDLDVDLEIDPGETGADIKREALQQTPLFSALSPASLARLIDKVQLVELPAGQFLFRQGDRGTGLFVVAEGKVAVVADGPPESVVVELGDGDFFGEVAVVTDQPRNAGVRALVDTELLCIERKLLRELIAEEPAVLPVLLRFLRERLVDNLIRISPLFAPFQGAERDDLIRRFNFLEIERGTVLVKEGELSPAFYVTMAGRLSVDRVVDNEIVALAELGAGDVFGEMSILANGAAVASVRAQSKCLVLELPGQPFRELIMTHPHVLAFIGDLAAERESALARMAGGEQQYEELHLDLF